jgi:hypothetical protein
MFAKELIPWLDVKDGRIKKGSGKVAALDNYPKENIITEFRFLNAREKK